MRILGFVLLIVAVGIGLASPALIDIPSALIVLGLPLAGLLAGFGTGFGTAWKAVFSGDADRESLQLGIAVFERGKSLASIAGGLGGTLIGLVIMLKNMDDPNAIGPGMALGILTILYGILLAYGVFLPLAASLRQKLDDLD